ncbi:uncharacterized protein C10orf88-like [Centruroides sculpturatus]|uniref:uncharacterized protein C10orf88-like n=1 Tax=Centruroides sculpturatus TaxID=218467 RepID=UPI000C6DC95A|nr:uncharacterized protein C10orf88-like [Centruroides sculpturatus]
MDCGVVQSNWRAKENKNIKDCVQWCLGNQSSDVEDAVQVENCIMLEPMDDDASGLFASPACQLLLTCPENFEMKNISILSEARIIEVFGHHGEYLKTCRSDLIEEVDDMAVFRTEIIFDKALTVCSLKFTSLKSKKSMWLYGVRVILHPMIAPQIGSKIPLENVNFRLGNMGSKLSERAEAFKQMVGNYQSAQNLGNVDYSTLAPMFQMLNMFNVTPKSPNEREFIGDSIPSSRSSDHGDWRKQNLFKKSAHTEELNDNLNDNREKILDANSNLEGNVAANINNLKQETTTEENLVQEKNRQDILISQLEERNLEAISKLIEKSNEQIEKQLEQFQNKLWEKTEKRLQELEQKILCKLDEILTFIKPHGVSR